MKVSVGVIVTVLMGTCSGGLLFGHYGDGGFEGGGGVYFKVGGGHRGVAGGHRASSRGYRGIGSGYRGVAGSDGVGFARSGYGRAFVPAADVLQDLPTYDARQVLKIIQAIQERGYGGNAHAQDSYDGDYDKGFDGSGHGLQRVPEQQNLEILRDSGIAADVGYSGRDYADNYGDEGVDFGPPFKIRKSFKIFGFFGGHGGFVKFF